MDVTDLTLAQLTAELRLAAAKCPKCEGAREHPFISRGRENIVNCLQCAPIYTLLEPLEAALEILREA
jgi:hypothetical protein